MSMRSFHHPILDLFTGEILVPGCCIQHLLHRKLKILVLVTGKVDNNRLSFISLNAMVHCTNNRLFQPLLTTISLLFFRSSYLKCSPTFQWRFRFVIPYSSSFSRYQRSFSSLQSDCTLWSHRTQKAMSPRQNQLPQMGRSTWLLSPSLELAQPPML